MNLTQIETGAFAKKCIILSRDQICKLGFWNWIGIVPRYSESFCSSQSKFYFASYGQNGLKDTCVHLFYHSSTISPNVIFPTGYG